jgi:hypothetical protein
MTIRTELLSGLLFTGFGLFVAVNAYRYDLGTVRILGPGAFPLALSVILVIIGVATILRAVLVEPGEAIAFQPRPLALILLAVGLFGLGIGWLGLFPALALLVVLGRLAGGNASWREALAMVIVYSALAYVVFAMGLGIHFKLWPA